MSGLVDHSEKFRKQMRRNAAAALNRGNEFLIREAAGAAPVASGTLQESLQVVREATEQSPIAVGAAKAEYAAIVNRHNTPFWTQAWIRMKAQFGEFFRG